MAWLGLPNFGKAWIGGRQLLKGLLKGRLFPNKIPGGGKSLGGLKGVIGSPNQKEVNFLTKKNSGSLFYYPFQKRRRN